MAGRGDHLPGLQAEATAGVAALSPGRPASRGASSCLAPAVRPHPRPPASRRGARAAGVPHLWPGRTRLRPGLVLDLSDQLPDPLLLSWPLVLPVLREEALAAVGRVAPPGGPRAGPPPPRGRDHPASTASALPAPPRAAAGPRPLRRGRPGRIRAKRASAKTCGQGSWSRSPPPEIWPNGIPTSTYWPATAASHPTGPFIPSSHGTAEALMTLFRQALLERLVARHAISEELKVRLLGWRHPGFSTHVGEPIPPNDARAIEDMASYVVRNPVSLKRLVYIDGQQAVIYRALRSNPSLGANFVALDPLGVAGAYRRPHPGPGQAPHAVLRPLRQPRPGGSGQGEEAARGSRSRGSRASVAAPPAGRG